MHTNEPVPNCGSDTGRGATVTGPGGRVQRVKNLDWLLRHRDSLVAVNFRPLTPAGCWPATDAGGIMTADLEGERAYRCQWASESVFRGWAGRFLKYWPVTYV